MKISAIIISVLSLLIYITFALPICGGNDLIITDDQVAGIKVGQLMDDLYGLYTDERLKMGNLSEYAEGFFCPGVEVYREKHKTPSFNILFNQNQKDDWIVDMIVVLDKDYKTKKGIGVESTVNDLKKAYKIRDVSFFEGSCFIEVEGFRGSFIVRRMGPEEYNKYPNPNYIDLVSGEDAIVEIRVFRRR